MGFNLRERFYAGADAGWGAQILEHPVSRVVIFADVDITADELNTDFGITALPPSESLDKNCPCRGCHDAAYCLVVMTHVEAAFLCCFLRYLLTPDVDCILNTYTHHEAMQHRASPSE